MAGLVPVNGDGLALKNWLNKTAPQDQRLKLFINDITPNKATVAADFSEASFTGYAFKALSGASWTVTERTSDAIATYAAQTFTRTASGAPQTAYGYYVVQATSGIVMFAERFPNPQVVQFNGDFITVLPTTNGN